MDNIYEPTNNKQSEEVEKSVILQRQPMLIKQWRTSLDSLKSSVDFELLKASDKEDEELITILEAADYLDKKNTLLDENDDFQFSRTGFLKYQAKHMQVFDYLSQRAKNLALSTDSNSYFYSLDKHIEQQKKPTDWKHALVHFFLMLVTISALCYAGLWVVDQTQDNLLVITLLVAHFFMCIKETKDFVIKYKKNAATPFKYSLSSLGLYSINILFMYIIFSLIPILIALKFKQVWVDDVIIISLVSLGIWFFIPSGSSSKEPALIESTTKESVNV